MREGSKGLDRDEIPNKIPSKFVKEENVCLQLLKLESTWSLGCSGLWPPCSDFSTLANEKRKPGIMSFKHEQSAKLLGLVSSHS